MTVISFILFMSLGITGPVNSPYVASLGASYVEIGLFGTVTSLTVILFGFVWGRASDGLGGRKPFLVAGLAAMALIHGGIRRRARDAVDPPDPAHPRVCLFRLHRSSDDVRDGGPVAGAAGDGLGSLQLRGGLGSILGAPLGGIQTQLMGFRAMIGTNAALIFGGRSISRRLRGKGWWRESRDDRCDLYV